MQRISSIALLILFLTAQVGLTFGVHYCQGEAVRSSILWTSTEVPDCGMEQHDRNCEEDIPSLEKHCCDDERSTVRNEQEHLPSVPQDVRAPDQKPELLHTALEGLQPLSFSKGNPEPERTPPSGLSPSEDLSVRFQVFRL